MLAGYRHFARVARRGRWDDASIDLRADARTWPRLEPADRERVLLLLAGFTVAESGVAETLGPFAGAAGDPDVATCFRLQRRDERRHARFVDRVACEVVDVRGQSAAERRRALRGLLDDRFLELFERRLPETARRLAAGESSLADAVALYHLVLEGVVLSAGQAALIALLERVPGLPGLRDGIERVARDERWHIGFGARCLADAAPGAATLSRLREEGERAARAWGYALPPEVASRAGLLHERRLRAADLTPAAA